MLYEDFQNAMDRQRAYQQSKNQLDIDKINEIQDLSNQLGIKKMQYEHSGQAAWKRRWQEAERLNRAQA